MLPKKHYEKVFADCRKAVVKELKRIEDYIHTFVHIDKETGVEYLVLFDGNYFRSICPRYNADGTLRINEEFRK